MSLNKSKTKKVLIFQKNKIDSTFNKKVKIRPKKKFIKGKLMKNKNQNSLKDLIKYYEKVKKKGNLD